MSEATSEMVRRVNAAIGAKTHIWQRVDMTKPLPFQVIDRTGHPIVLSSWTTSSAADKAWRQADGARRARAAIEAMREPTEAMLSAVIPFPEHLRHEYAPDSPWHTLMAAATTADRMAFRSRWQDGIDAALISERGAEE